MSGGTRRAFLLGVAGCAVCGACTSGGTEESSATSTTAPGTSTTADGRSAEPAFGAPVPVGALDEILERIDAGGGFLYVPAARAHVVRYPAASLAAAREVYDPETLRGLERGVMALFQKCTHLGCRVPECTSSGRFECPCHGGVFNQVGEHVAGPAPRGLDRFALVIENDQVAVDTGTVLPGLEPGIVTVDAEPVGAPCISVSSD